MKKVLLNYNEQTGEIQDANGGSLFFWTDLAYFEEEAEEKHHTLDKLTKLRAMSLNVEEIRELSKLGLL